MTGMDLRKYMIFQVSRMEIIEKYIALDGGSKDDDMQNFLQWMKQVI